MFLSGDTYIHLTNFVDDKTVLNMLSVNKKFHKQSLFKNAIKRRYSYLIAFKAEEESWKNLYIRMVYCLAKLFEKFEIPYISTESYNPEELYITYKTFVANTLKAGFNKSYRVFKAETKIFMIQEATKYAVTGANLDIVKYFIETKGANLQIALENAIGHWEIYGECCNQTQEYFDHEINVEIIEYLLNKGADIIKVSESFGHDPADIIDSLVERGMSKQFLDDYLINKDCSATLSTIFK